MYGKLFLQKRHPDFVKNTSIYNYRYLLLESHHATAQIRQISCFFSVRFCYGLSHSWLRWSLIFQREGGVCVWLCKMQFWNHKWKVLHLWTDFIEMLFQERWLLGLCSVHATSVSTCGSVGV